MRRLDDYYNFLRVIAGQLDAVERHLADMRAIAFNKLEINRE